MWVWVPWTSATLTASGRSTMAFAIASIKSRISPSDETRSPSPERV